MTSGEAEGSRISLRETTGDLAFVDFPDLAQVLEPVRFGDTVTIDNSNALAAQTYHRHQVPAAEFTVWDQYRNPDGTPALPQRPFLAGPIFTQGASGVLQTGSSTAR
ncbi:hypothetical protein [Pseudarthrobacter sulfonivorans]|uniref:hypothetical protein n=1 Tax=Pseudarthrobacter sulfonivorans TaxID=121292 RepID=UPI000A7A2E5D|nr:hypothetical protein [Pseudarthrobacter sulfonivorans]